MYSLKDYFKILNEIAPLSISQKMIELGDYDNSGIIIEHHNGVEKALFSLDLTVESVKTAKRNHCDTIVTHHPAIYRPISKLSFEDAVTRPILMAIDFGMNVISMHLNLDMAPNGIDSCLCDAFGGTEPKIIDTLYQGVGYGREFYLNDTLGNIKKLAKKRLGTDKILVYGKDSVIINKAASLCGSGGENAKKYFDEGKTDADLIITSDLPHHLIKEFIENGKILLLIPHYSAENFGFKVFYNRVIQKTNIQTLFFDDRRFK